MKKRVYILLGWLIALIMSSHFAFGQAVRTTEPITLYSQPSLKAPAPTYPKVNSLLIIGEKATEEFWKVRYMNELLYMHESSRQYCVPDDSIKEENPVNPMDSVFKNKLVVPWYAERYGVISIDSLSEDQCKDALKRASLISIPGMVIAIAGGIGIAGGFIKIEDAQDQDPNTIGGYLDRWGEVFGGILIVCCSALMEVPGITLWSIGAGRKADIRKVLDKIPARISINPYITNDFNHYSTGLTLTFTF